MKDTDIDEIHKKIGLNVAKYRKEAGLSQLDLSLKNLVIKVFLS